MILDSQISCQYPSLPRDINYEPIIFPDFSGISVALYLEQCMTKFSDRIAVKAYETQLTYNEVFNKAKKIANAIKAVQSSETELIALLFSHSSEMIISLIGVLLSGKTFICLDPDMPAKKTYDIINNLKIGMLITDIKSESLISDSRSFAKNKISIIFFEEAIKNNKEPYILPQISENDIAFLLYTSGSTGEPKGIIQTNKNVLFYIFSYINALSINKEDKIGLLTNYSHAVAFIDILSAFFTGATLLLFNLRSISYGTELGDWLNKEKITVYHSVPTLYRFVMNNLQSNEIFENIRLFILGGESVTINDWKLYKLHSKKECVFVNFYGASEVLTASFYYMNHESNLKSNLVPIGRFIQGLNVSLKKEDNTFAQIGEIGEIVYESEFISLDSWNNRNTIKDKVTTRIFKIGDLGRLMPDGQIEYLGRNDSMVKIKGNRVELAEVEAHLMTLLPIKQCLVIVKTEENDSNKLVLFYTTKDKKELREKYIIKTLKDNLPIYMIPSSIIFLESFPLTASGKIDRKLINTYKIAEKAASQVFDNIQSELSCIWISILNLNEKIINLHHSFIELGGNSLHLFILINEIKDKFDIDVKFSELFENIKFSEMAQFIENGANNRGLFTSEEPQYEVKHQLSNYIPLSSSQKRIYVHMAQICSETAYNQTTALYIKGSLDISKVNSIFRRLVERHEMLRTSIISINGEVMQQINNNIEFNIEIHDCEKALIQQKIAEFVRPFELSEPTMLRVGILRINENEYILVIDIHHIIADGISLNILLKEFFILFEEGDLAPLDYYNNQEPLEQHQFLRYKKYWEEKFKSPLSSLSFTKLSEKNLVSKSINFTIDYAVTQRLYELANKREATPFIILLSIYFILLYRYKAQEDMVINIPVAGRNSKKFQNAIGTLINILPIRCHINDNCNFYDVINVVKETVFQSFDNQELPFEQIIDIIRKNNLSGKEPLLNILFVLQDMGKVIPEMEDFHFERYNININNTAYDICIEAVEIENSIQVTVKYNPDNLDYEIAERFTSHYSQIVQQFIANPLNSIAKFPILTDDDHTRLITFNSTEIDYTLNSINRFFEDQVKLSPKHTALIYRNNYISYEDLEKQANQIAEFLTENKVKKNQIIGIMLHRSIYMPISVMAVHKAGCAYLPLSPEYPPSRISYILKDSNVELLLTDSNCTLKELDYTGQTVLLDQLDFSKYKGEKNISLSNAQDIAYVIYTSGTTGLPKGVAVQHSSISNFLIWMQSKFCIGNKSTILLKTPFVFDASMREILWWGMFGATLSILEPGDEKDPVRIVENIKFNNVTHINFVPSMLNAFLQHIEINHSEIDKLNSLEYVFCCGEPLTSSMVKRFNKCFAKAILCNLYGPTEATVDITYYICDKHHVPDIIPIGKPVSNSKIHIINEFNQLQPIGVIGELCTTGDCISLGYINNKKATDEKFVDNEFDYNSKMYHTGDMARWTPDGLIQYINRKDKQIKIHGYRIELDDVKNNLLMINDIKEAIVLDFIDESGDTFLCAYCIFNKIMTVAEIRKELSKLLPEYMIPSVFVSIQTIPTNINGKLDKKKLPAPVSNLDIGISFYPPQNEKQRILANIWSELLSIKNVGIYDNFFYLGGNSIKIMQMVSRLNYEYDIELPLRKVYSNPTIYDLEKYLYDKKNNITVFTKADNCEYYPLSSAQKRIYFSSVMKKNIYEDNNAVISFNIKGEVDIANLATAFQKLLDRHEVLRTSYTFKENDLVQRVHSDVNFSLECVRTNVTNIENVISTFNTPFDLNSFPLIKAMIATIDCNSHILYICIHHIAFDGFSRNILINEISMLYQGLSLADLNYQYKDYAVWQNKFSKSNEIMSQRSYWINQFSNLKDRPELFLDYQRPHHVDFGGDYVDFSVPQDLVKKLSKIALDSNTSLFMVMFAVYFISLHKKGGLDDITVGIPEVGRHNPIFEQMIGMFVNTLPIRTFVTKSKLFIELLCEIKEIALKAIENKDYQYDVLVNDLDIKSDLSRNALFDTMFAFQNIKTDELKLKNLQTKPYIVKDLASYFDIVFYAYEDEDINCKLTYSKQLYKKESMEMLIKIYLSIAEQISNNPNILIKDIFTDFSGQKKIGKIDFNFSNFK